MRVDSGAAASWAARRTLLTSIVARGALFTVVIEPVGWHFDADPDRTLLHSARAARIVLPASCRNGTCRTCMCLLTRGAVTYRIEWPGLLAEEKRDGWILPCVAYPQADLTIEQSAAER